MSHPHVIIGAYIQPSPTLQPQKPSQIPALRWPIGNIGASARPMVALSGFYESHEPPPSGDARGIVLPHRHGHRNGQQRGGHVAHRCVDCVPGGRRGNTEQVVARWQSLVAFMKALDLLHWAMCSLFTGTPPCLSKWPATEVHLFTAAAYFDCCNRS